MPIREPTTEDKASRLALRARAIGPSEMAGKMRRRRAIIEAAYDIISKEGDTGLTMRRLAARAGVSPATPYNLFGTKEAIIRTVFDEDFLIFERQFSGQRSDGRLARIFDHIDATCAAFKARPDFYRAVFRTLNGRSTSEIRSSEWLRTSYLDTIVAEAIASGHLLPRFGRLSSVTIVRMYRSAILEWVADELSVEEAGRQVGLATALFLSSSVPRQFQSELTQIRKRYELES